MASGETRIGEVLPAVMDDHDLQRVLGLSRSQYYKFRKDGRYDMFLLRELGVRRYSGALVQRWLDGGGTPQAQFGHLHGKKKVGREHRANAISGPDSVGR